ncbi:hypothetical protein [Marinobacter sp. ATCH36]|uniref:capsular polysaccharide export protein, LipB/KpsS family n=1 Tax=Marinobacter sp. ATCH36 TaxID=2945106 RepID=UPI0020202C45|nr:hypothetical protein [Marinobacter sp. ATCH36]MCL7945960.1 hypothetical protein [Marinobacter sp. ATCH36]
MSNRGLFFVTNHENAPLISKRFVESYPVIVSREESDLNFSVGVACEFYSTEYIKSPFAERVGGSDYKDIEASLDLALGNAHTFFILERLRYFNGTAKIDPFRSCFNYLPYLQESLLRTADVLHAANPDYIVFSSTPHDLEAWLTFLHASSLGVPVYVVCQTELPWRVFLKKIRPEPSLGYRILSYYPDRNLPHQKQVVIQGRNLSSAGHDYILAKRNNYSLAEPQYMKQQKSGGGKSLALRAQKLKARLVPRGTPKNRTSASNFDRELSKMLDRYRASKLRRALKKYAIAAIPDGKFVCLFLHFQPERTSIPEGGRYASQINAISALRSQLPDDCALLVKEHPSMFLLKSKRPFRHPDFYTLVASMPKTYMLDESHSSFDLIDQAQAVATLTGTVGFEALCRGCVAIVLGDAAYRGYPGVVDLYDSQSRDITLEKKIALASAELKDSSVIEACAVITEQASHSDGIRSELVTPDTMNIALMALADEMDL